MAMMGDHLVMDDDFMRLLSRCCQCGNESGKPDRLKFLPCSHLMCIRCLEGVRTGTNTTARTPRTLRDSESVQNGGLTNGSLPSQGEIFLTEVGELPEGKREMYTKAFCPACDNSFLVPNTNLSIFEDDFHNMPILSRFITGQKRVCEMCIEKKEKEKIEAAEKKKADAAEKDKKGGHKHKDDATGINRRPAGKQAPKRESRGINTSPPPPSPQKKGTPPQRTSPPQKKGEPSPRGPAKKGGKVPPGGAKRGKATIPPKGRQAKGQKKDQSPPPKIDIPPRTPTPPKQETPPPPPEISPEGSKNGSDKLSPLSEKGSPRSEKGSPRSDEGSPRSDSEKASTPSKINGKISKEPTTSEQSDMTLELDGTPAEFFCMGCNKFLCSSCSHEHLSPENLREHRLVPAHEYSLTTQEDNVSCIKHPEKRYTHFCLSEKCQRAICAVCLNQTHQEHRVEPIAKVTRDTAVLREVLHNSKAVEMKVRLRMRELQESKIQDEVIDTLNEEIERLKTHFITLMDDYKSGINSRFNEINGKIEIDETRVHSYLEKMKKMNGILNNVINRPDYVDQDLLILAHFLGANQDILTNERKVDDLMREKTLIVQHYGLDFGELQSVFKASKELPQTIPFDLLKTERQDFPIPKRLKCTSSNRLMAGSSRPHTFDIFPNNDIVVLDPKGRSIHKYQCVSAGGIKQHRFQCMYYQSGREKASDVLVCPSGIATYEGYTFVCDANATGKGSVKRGHVLVFDDKLNNIDAIPLEAVPHSMVSYQDQVYIGFKTKVMHFQIHAEEKYNGEVEFSLEHAETYYVGTEWWSSLTVNREGHLAIQDGNSEIYIFKDGKQALKPSTKIRGVRGISFFGRNKILVSNTDKNCITAYSVKDDDNGHPIIDKELPSHLLTFKEKVIHPLMAKVDFDGDLVVTDEKGQVKLYVSRK